MCFNSYKYYKRYRILVATGGLEGWAITPPELALVRATERLLWLQRSTYRALHLTFRECQKYISRKSSVALTCFQSSPHWEYMKAIWMLSFPGNQSYTQQAEPKFYTGRAESRGLNTIFYNVLNKLRYCRSFLSCIDHVVAIEGKLEQKLDEL